ncbi:Formin-like protein 11 [Orobanche gracilis]
MGQGSHTIHMVSIIIFFLISFYCTHILIAKAAFKAQGYLSIVSGVADNGNTLTAAHIIPTKLPVGVQSRYQENGLILKKLRFLLGFQSFNNEKYSRNARDSTIYLHPSPSPSPSAEGIPNGAPAMHVQPPSHHRHHSLPQAHKIYKEEGQGEVDTLRVVTAVVVFVVGGACLLCGIGLFLKFKKQRRRRRQRSSVLVFTTGAGSRGISTALMMSSDPGPCPFNLDSLNCSTEKTSPNQNSGAFDDIQGPNKCELSSCSSGEISCCPVHVISESVKHDEPTENCSDIFFPEEAHSSDDDDDDDESFHSFCNSQSSCPGISGASVNSLNLGETSDIIRSQDEFKKTLCSELQPSLPISFSQTRFQDGVSPPPPPCPPPLPKTHNLLNSVKAPPPPPPQLNQQVALGKDGTPLPKLKPLHWDKFRAAPNRSTVWDNLRSSSFEFDEKMIESLFSYDLQNPIKNDEAKSKTPSPCKHVLKPKRLQNISILSKALSATAEQVYAALIRGDGLSLQDLEALSKMVPTKEEEAKLINYKGDILELGSAEKLVKAMLKIPFTFSRIEAMLYRETFQDEFLHLRKSFLMLEESCKELRSSRLFLKLLEAVLKTGNRMNVGTIRGGAKAFKLDALLKLAHVKGTDGRTTLLHFVVQEIVRSEGIRMSKSIMGKIHQIRNSANLENKEESYMRMGLDLVSGLSTELCNAKKAATIDLDVLASSLANLSDGMHKLQDLVQRDMMIMEEGEGSFFTSMRSFLDYAEKKLKELQEDENIVLLRVREITEYFHGDVSKDESNPLQIFVIVRDFLSMLDNVCKELRSSKTPCSPNLLLPVQ